jgi:hypothetical protein
MDLIFVAVDIIFPSPEWHLLKPGTGVIPAKAGIQNV